MRSSGIPGIRAWLTLGVALLLPTAARGDEPMAAAAASPISAADSAFVMICTAMVMLMVPGLGLFYGGMVRRKNVLATFQQSFLMLGAIGLQWILFGYSLAFGPDLYGGLIGGLDWVGLSGVGLGPPPAREYGPTIPHQLHMVYQGMAAAITPALISGAFAERMKFSSYLVFSLLWSTFVYDPVAHWIWSPDGWLHGLGALDFAGGVVIHLLSGVAALACVLVVGRRKGLGEEEMYPHNLTLTAIGTGLLWFGWYGLNAGSALAASPAAVAALVTTHAAGAAGAVSWAAVEWWQKGKATVLGACTGAIAGLVAISPAAAYVTPIAALLMGLAIGLVCYGAVLLKGRRNYDDSLDVFAVHGVGGALGALAVGFLATRNLAGAGNAGGLFDGHANQVGYQAVCLLATTAYCFVASFGLLTLVNRTLGLRVTPEDEEVGLDLAQHGERGYIMGVGELLVGREFSEGRRSDAVLRSGDEPVTVDRP